MNLFGNVCNVFTAFVSASNCLLPLLGDFHFSLEFAMDHYVMLITQLYPIGIKIYSSAHIYFWPFAATSLFHLSRTRLRLVWVLRYSVP